MMNVETLPQAQSKSDCRSKTNAAVKKGILAKPNWCQRCGATAKLDKHHPDYTQPLLIRWLCKKCHTIEDKTRRMDYPADFKDKKTSYLLKFDDQDERILLEIQERWTKKHGRPISFAEIVRTMMRKEFSSNLSEEI